MLDVLPIEKEEAATAGQIARTDAIAAIDGVGPAQRPQRAGASKIGGLAAVLAPDLRRNPTQKIRYVGGDHRAPTDRAVGLRDFLDRAKYRQRVEFRPAHRTRQKHLQEPRSREGLRHQRRYPPDLLALLARSDDKRREAPRGCYNIQRRIGARGVIVRFHLGSSFRRDFPVPGRLLCPRRWDATKPAAPSAPPEATLRFRMERI